MIVTAKYKLGRTKRGDCISLSVNDGRVWAGISLDRSEATALRDSLAGLLEQVRDLERDTATEP